MTPHQSLKRTYDMEQVSEEQSIIDEIRMWSGSAFLAGEDVSKAEADVSKAGLYSLLCKLPGYIAVEAKELPLETVERVAAIIAPHLRQSYFNPDTDDQAEARGFAMSIARAAIASMGGRLPHEGVFVQLLIQTLDLSDELLGELEERGNLQAVAKAIIAECTTSLGTDGGEL